MKKFMLRTKFKHEKEQRAITPKLCKRVMVLHLVNCTSSQGDLSTNDRSLKLISQIVFVLRLGQNTSMKNNEGQLLLNYAKVMVLVHCAFQHLELSTTKCWCLYLLQFLCYDVQMDKRTDGHLDSCWVLM